MIKWGIVLMVISVIDIILWSLPIRQIQNNPSSPLYILFGFFAFFLAAGIIGYDIYKRKQEKEEEQARLERIEKILAEKSKKVAEINQSVKEGTWSFPVEKFFLLCRDNQVTALDNEFSIAKAARLAELLIKESIPEVDIENCGEYLKLESLETFLKKGRVLVRRSEERQKAEQKQPKDANCSYEESMYLERVEQVVGKYGMEKRKEMLEILGSDLRQKIAALIRGEEAMKLLSTIYAQQEKKESDWAIIGGIAEGIAGPAAGIMAASQTIANNRKVQEHNAAMRKASMDIMRGSSSMVSDRYELERVYDKNIKLRKETEKKITLSKPNAEAIWNNIKKGEIKVKKNPSGVLAISFPVSINKPFILDVPENVTMVVDGTIKGEVWFEDRFVGDVFFPLPLYGIPTNMTAEVTLDGMCGRSVEFDGEYTVKIADKQNLWIMEE